MRQARIRPDLAPAANAKAFRFLPKAARRHLAKHGFVVLEPPEAPAEVHNVYIENQYKRLPGFVTADAALHLTHLVFDLVLQDMEMRLLAPGLARWSADGANLARSLVTSLPPGLQDGMRRLAQRLAIGACLLGVEVQCEDAAVAHAARDIEELRCPESARCLDPDGYRVRGHYQNNESLQRYFRARLWLGENLTDWAEVAAAALLLSHWSDGRRTLARREELERSLVGPAANKTSTALLALARMNLGPSPDWSAWANARNWPDAAHLREQPISLLARRWTADNHVLSSGFDESRRPEPSPLDLLQALGSEEARRRLRDQEQAWPELSERLDAQRRSFRQGDLLDLFSVGGRWLAALRWLLLPYPKGYARFQQDPAWAGHGMVGAAASWAELRRDTLLYVQPPIHYMEGGDEDQLPAHQAGFVEAVPELYRELALVCDQSRKAYAGLGGQQLDQPTRRTSEAGPMTKLRRLEDLLDFLAACADKHLAGKALVRDEHQRLHGIGTEFEHIAAGKGHLKAKPVPVVADVFVVVDPEDGSRKRLMLATGPLRWIVVALPLGKRTILARGAVASFYSFWRAEPIDDQQWQDELDNAPSPKPVNWRASFPLPKRKARQ